MSGEITDEIVERLRNGGTRCDRGTDFADYPNSDDCPECDCAREAADEIQWLRADRDRWRKIADDFADAGTHPTAHDMVMEDYEDACRD